MYVETLRLTPSGLQAFTSAKDGGVYLRPVTCEFGDYIGGAQDTVPKSLVGNKLGVSRTLRFIEVLGGNLARFTFDIPSDLPARGEATIGEVMIRLEDGVPFAHVQLVQPIRKFYGNAHRISLLLYMEGETNFSKVFNVTMGEHATLPQVTSVNWMPPPDAAMNSNVVVVADVFQSSNGTSVPGLAFRTGLGEYGWSFYGFDRVWSDALGSRFVSKTQIKADDIDGLSPSDNLIVSCVSGGGAGYCRKASFDGTMITLDDSVPSIPDFSAASSVAILVPLLGGGASGGTPITWPPGSEDVPEDWVLTPGSDGVPQWRPPSSARPSAQGVVLYSPPSKLVSRSLVTTAQPSVLEYTLPEAVDTPADVILTVGGVAQPHTAYDIFQGDTVKFTEAVPSPMSLNARAFTREASTGHKTEIQVITAVGNGGDIEVDVGADITDVEQVFLVVGGIINPVTSYTVSNGKLRFTEALPAGITADIYVFRSVAHTGASTKLVVHQTYIDMPTNYLQLSVAPVSQAHVIVLDNGRCMMQDEYQLTGDHIFFDTKLAPNAYSAGFIEVIVFINHINTGSPDRSLDGALTHAYSSASGMIIERQGQSPLRIPYPRPIFFGSNGIVVDQSLYPMVKLTYNPAENKGNAKRTQTYNASRVVQDTEEVIIEVVVDVPVDMTVQALATFNAKLGPGFQSTLGRERIECVLAVIRDGDKAPEYGNNARGTGQAGFSLYSEEDDAAAVYADRSLQMVVDIDAQNYPTKKVNVVAKLRVVGATISAYSSELNIQLDIVTMR